MRLILIHLGTLLTFLYPFGILGETEATVNWEWRNPLPNGNSPGLSSLAFGNGQWVAVGSLGTVVRSMDGFTWSTEKSGVAEWLSAVSFGNGTWIAVGNNGTVISSRDGVQWRQENPGTGQPLLGVGFGNGQWIAVGYQGTVITSADGQSWIVRRAGSNDLSGVAYGNGRWTAVGNGSILTSSNGISWMEIQNSPGGALKRVVYENGLWAATGYPGRVVTSVDGVSWTLSWTTADVAPSDRSTLDGIGYGNGLWIAQRGSRILTSLEGLRWAVQTNLPSFTDGTYQFNSSDIKYANGRWIAVGGTMIFTSTDADSWQRVKWQSEKTGVTMSQLRGVAFGNGEWLAIGEQVILGSTDGKTWQTRLLPPDLQSNEKSFQDIAFADGQWVVVSQQGPVLSSRDGINWTLGTRTQSLTSWPIRCVAYGNGKWIAGGHSGTVLSSTDGQNWKPQNSVRENVLDLSYGNGLWVAVGLAVTSTSTDGENWKTTEWKNWPLEELRAVTYSNSRWLIGGGSGSLLTSEDGNKWVKTASVSRSAGDVAIRGIAFGDGVFTIVAGGGPPLFSISRDEGVWSTSAFASPTLNAVAYGNGSWIAVGESGTILQRSLTTSFDSEWRRVIETKPPQPIYGACPEKRPGKDSLVVITHGRIPREPSQATPPGVEWVDDMVEAIKKDLAGRGVANWEVVGYKWSPNAWTTKPEILTKLLRNAEKEGASLGNCLKKQGWKHIHFIGHSAGAA